MTQDSFSPGGCMRHPRGSPTLTASAPERGHRASPTLHTGAVTGAPRRPKMPSPGVSLPGPFVTAPSPDPPVGPPWLHTLAKAARFEQGVLYGRGPAQVGVGATFFLLSSPHRLFIGRLSPEPLRLTQRVRERLGLPASPSPLSQWGQFPIFTGVRVAHRATPTKVAP
jgi:hypothetical protein